MNASSELIIVSLVLLPVAGGCVALLRWLTRLGMRFTRAGSRAALIPPAVMLLLFVSLAGHMQMALGHFPSVIGMGGFPAALENHAVIAGVYFACVLLFFLLVWPLLIVVCGLLRPLRKAAGYLAIYGLGQMLVLGLMLLAPSAYLNWWMD